MSNLQNILSTLNTALGVLKTVTETPGINALPYVNTISSALRAIEIGVNAGANVLPYVEALAATFTQDKVPTEAELAALDAKIAELEAKVNAPLPEKEEGEDD